MPEAASLLKDRIWRKINNNPIFVAIGVLVAIAGTTTTLWSEIKPIITDIMGEKLIVPDITSLVLTSTLSGLPPKVDKKTGTIVFPDGVAIKLPLSRTGASHSAVSILGIAVRVDYEAGSRPDLAYRIPEGSLHPLGDLPAREFDLALTGTDIEVDWIRRDAGGASRVRASPSNLLEVDNHEPLFRGLEAGLADPYVFKIHTNKERLYHVYFDISYTIGDKERVAETKTICVYHSGA